MTATATDCEERPTLQDTVRQQDLDMRHMFSRTIVEDSFSELMKKDPTLFNQTLSLANERNWVKPKELADCLGTSESNTRKWFKTEDGVKATPAYLTMVQTMLKLSELLVAK